MKSIDDNGQNLRPDPDLIRGGLEAVKIPDRPIEVRVLKIRHDGPLRWYGTTYNGFYDDLDAAVRDVSRITGRDAAGVYMTINELDPIVRNWGHNRLARAEKAASDGDVISLRHLYIDLDVIRKALTNTTAAEHAAAMERLEAVRQRQRAGGWPEPVLAGSSGSGAMALYRIELPPSEAGMIEHTLKALAAEFDDDVVQIDKSVHNPARIVRLPGSINAKSPTPQPDRPWSVATAKAVTDDE